MNNELELRLECMKLAVAITPTLGIPIQDRIADNFNFILNKVTDNGNTTFDSLKEKRAGETIESITSIMSILEGFISGLKSDTGEELDIPIPKEKPVVEDEQIKTSKRKVTQPKTEIKEETV